jgi:hypothetical protein
MKRIVSVSRRTDIPAFYGDWFMRRLKEGFAGFVSPFGAKRYIVSLKREDVVCLVFWSKDFTPFLEKLKVIEDLGYKFYFNYTVTGLPTIFEGNVKKDAAIETLKLLSKTYSPQHINWRFDPIIISSICDRDFWIKAFEELAAQFEGLVERCYFSFVTEYNKVKRNFDELKRSTGVTIAETSEGFKIDLANELAAIAERHGVQMFSCCGDYLVGEKIKKAHCIDGGIVESLFYPEGLQYSEKPTRSQCGCTESTDIGTYNTCPHGCVYCYANADKPTVYKAFRTHDRESAFLGYTKSDSDRWLAELQNNGIGKDAQQWKAF